MPIYEYQCADCCKVFDQIQKFNDPPPNECPACKGNNVKKLISLSSFHLKGSGWYVTDYGRGNGAAKARSKHDTDSTSAKSDGSTKGDKEKKKVIKKQKESSTSTKSTEVSTPK